MQQKPLVRPAVIELEQFLGKKFLHVFLNR